MARKMITITTRPPQEGKGDEWLTGHSKWWGAPDLPADIPYPFVDVDDHDGGTYPEPLTFICQIRLSDIAQYDPENRLPHSGMLYFFAAIDYFLGEDSPLDLPSHGYSGELVRVIHSEQEDGLQPYRLTWEDSDESIFRKAEEITFGLTDGSYNVFSHGLFGDANDEVAGWYPHMLPLLRVEEEDRWNLRFYDCGTLYFLIDPDDLRRRRFDKVSTELFFY